MADGEKNVWVTSLYGAATHEGLVELSVDDTVVAQMRPHEARDLALHLLEGAEAAEGDQFLVEFMAEAMQWTDDEASTMLRPFRAFREAHRRAPMAEEGKDASIPD